MNLNTIIEKLVQKQDEILETKSLREIERILMEKGLDCSIKDNSVFFSLNGFDFYIDQTDHIFVEINHVIRKDSNFFKRLKIIKNIEKVNDLFNARASMLALTEIRLIDGSISYSLYCQFIPTKEDLDMNVKMFIQDVSELYKESN